MAVSTADDSDVLSEINITPLVDVMLVLLVAFVITIPALTNAIHVNLPRTVQTTPPEQQKAITVTVDTAGTIYFDDVVVTEADLPARLAQIKAASSDPSLHLRADDRVPYGSVAKVMAAIEHSGISKVSVLTDNQ
ncbi:MAG TPA: biopolymer transporter ExbD [Steroidobacteraceae bacterium]|nr:biopolymer transporter ExbD [Steroidobacteraceae bacterium]